MQIAFHIIYLNVFISYFNKWNSQKFWEFKHRLYTDCCNFQIDLLFFFFFPLLTKQWDSNTRKKKVLAIILMTFSHYKTSIVFLYTIFWVVKVYANKVVNKIFIKKKKKIKHSCKKKIKIGFCVNAFGISDSRTILGIWLIQVTKEASRPIDSSFKNHKKSWDRAANSKDFNFRGFWLFLETH